MRPSGGEYLLAITTIQDFARRLATAFTQFDAWLSPTVPQPPPRLGELVASDTDPDAAEERAAQFVAFPLDGGSGVSDTDSPPDLAWSCSRTRSPAPPPSTRWDSGQALIAAARCRIAA
jgi:hypothetical protein